MYFFHDLTNQQFGRLTVLEKTDARVDGGKVVWLCRCTCGTLHRVSSKSLRSGNTKSCGCLHRDSARERHTKHGAAGDCNGQNKSPEYRAWAAAKWRCNNPDPRIRQHYKDRGIVMCEEWRMDFSAFLRDMGPKPTAKHTLDRYPDNGGPYAPGNCRWATMREQAFNRRHPRPYTKPNRRRSGLPQGSARSSSS